MAEAFGSLSPEAYADAIKNAAAEYLRSSLSAEAAELFERTARFNAVKQSERETVSSSGMFAAAALWGREPDAPPQLRRLAAVIEWEAFDAAFLRGMIGSEYQSALASRAFDGVAKVAQDLPAPVFSDNLRKVLQRLGQRTPERPVAVRDILIALVHPEVTSATFRRRLDAARLSPDAVYHALVDDPDEPAPPPDERPPPQEVPLMEDHVEEEKTETTSVTHFAADRPQTRHDKLGRGPLAFAIAHLMCRIAEDQRGDTEREDGAFVMHLDSPWGGGKTTFANFVAEILSLPPGEAASRQAMIALARDLGAPVTPESWPGAPDGAPWITARFNAWRNEHVAPPWWNFYEAIRAQCLAALPAWQARRLRVREVFWRLASPETRRSGIGLVVMLIVLVIVFGTDFGGWLASQLPGEAAPPTLLSALLLTVAGGSGLHFVLSARRGAESLIEAAGRGGDPRIIGEGDPLLRFRDHFASFTKSLERPVLVIVDDLDRCQPDHVVGLMRGMMTVFSSPHVIYFVLGDRNWIETCFARAFASMVGDDQDRASFGGRFAEKAMQLSFLLPSPPADRIAGYLDDVLLLRAGDRAKAGAGGPAEAVADEAATAIAGAATENDRNEAARAAKRQVDTSLSDPVAREVAHRRIDATVAIEAARSERAPVEIGHHLQDLHGLLPSNPRQIKRIVNMIALYQASALAVLKIEQGSRDWRGMVLWVLLMARHPAVWRRLAADPRLADRLARNDAPAGDIELAAFIGSPMFAAIAGPLKGDFADVRLDAKRIVDLSLLTPR